ncbi:MAG: DUF4230 domain-containing protein [Clostridium sp.]|nr:DUF4230 domain-containing protein [Acetatifactor muris]MCM1527908.1 DUF4230 domain-containing protein [Bacteroides sp.]MCM1564025.1 DUF4230 domain-containing protein [Clostridium sp.]
MRNDTQYDAKYKWLLERSRRFKASVITVIVVIVALILFICGYRSATGKYKEQIAGLKEEVGRLSDEAAVYGELTKEVDIQVINAEIQDIGELITAEYLYTDAGKFEDPAVLFGQELPFSFTTKSFIVKWDGSIKAGVDITKVQVQENEATKEILVFMPPAEILSHEIDDDSIETLDEKNGLFNEIKVEDVREFDAISKNAMEERAIENGILRQAMENAQDIIYRHVYTDAVREAEYTVTFKIMEE